MQNVYSNLANNQRNVDRLRFNYLLYYLFLPLVLRAAKGSVAYELGREGSARGEAVMGYMRHHAIVVTSYRQDEIAGAHILAKNLGCSVSEISAQAVNGYSSFCVFPDGSKEGWPPSDAGNTRRDALIAYLTGKRGVVWAEIQYGDDEFRTLVTRHSDEQFDNEQ